MVGILHDPQCLWMFTKHTCWTIFLILVIIFRCTIDPIGELMHYYTNWAWIIHLCYFTFGWIGFFSASLKIFSLRWLYLLAYTTSWLVLILISTILAYDSYCLQGISLRLGWLICGHVVMHAIPIIAILVCSAYKVTEILEILQFPALNMPPWLWVAIQCILPMLPMLLFRIIFDPRSSYGYQFPEWAAWVITIVVIAVVVIPWMVLSRKIINKSEKYQLE